jgi:hypothetical protein
MGDPSSPQQQYEQDDQDDEADTAAPVAVVGRQITSVAAKEGKHDEDEDDNKQKLQHGFISLVCSDTGLVSAGSRLMRLAWCLAKAGLERNDSVIG